MEQISIDVNELQKKIIELGYADTRVKAKFAVSFVCAGDHAGLAAVLRYGGAHDDHKDALVLMTNVADAETLIKWHKDSQPSSDGEPWQAAEAKAAYDKIASKSGLDHEAFKPGALLREIEGLLNTPVATPWEKGEADELEQVWRILMGYDEECMQVPPRQRGSVVMVARNERMTPSLRAELTKALEATGMVGQGAFDTVVAYLTNYFQTIYGSTKIIGTDELSRRVFAWLRGENELGELCELFDCAPGELVETVQKMAGERESVRSVFGVSAGSSLFDVARALKEYSDKAHKAIAGRNIHIDDLPGMISLMCRCIGSNDREVILARLALAGNMVEELGGWDYAYENLRKLDKAAEDLVNRNTNFDQMIEDRDAWRRIALKLAE